MDASFQNDPDIAALEQAAANQRKKKALGTRDAPALDAAEPGHAASDAQAPRPL